MGLELPGRYSEICVEHRTIAQARANGDKANAEFQARQHLSNTAKRIADYFHIDREI